MSLEVSLVMSQDVIMARVRIDTLGAGIFEGGGLSECLREGWAGGVVGFYSDQ